MTVGNKAVEEKAKRRETARLTDTQKMDDGGNSNNERIMNGKITKKTNKQTKDD